MRRIVAFRWLDAVTSHGWEPGTDTAADPCVACGVLIAETEREITLAVAVSKDVNGDLQTNARMTIPKGWIEGPIMDLAQVVDNRIKPKRRK